MPRAYYSDVQCVTSLIDALMKCGDVEGAELLFDQAKIKDLPMYGAMMKGKMRRSVRITYSIVISI